MADATGDRLTELEILIRLTYIETGNISTTPCLTVREHV